MSQKHPTKKLDAAKDPDSAKITTIEVSDVAIQVIPSQAETFEKAIQTSPPVGMSLYAKKAALARELDVDLESFEAYLCAKEQARLQAISMLYSFQKELQADK